MTRAEKIFAGLVLSSGLAMTVGATYAHPGAGGQSLQQGMTGGMQRGMEHQSMTPQEHAALREKMRNAKTLDERQEIAQETHARMQRRATENQVTPSHSGGIPPTAPDAGNLRK